MNYIFCYRYRRQNTKDFGYCATMMILQRCGTRSAKFYSLINPLLHENVKYTQKIQRFIIVI